MLHVENYYHVSFTDLPLTFYGVVYNYCAADRTIFCLLPVCADFLNVIIVQDVCVFAGPFVPRLRNGSGHASIRRTCSFNYFECF